ncbi:hypothetical protein [Salirhabdus sp. Marseille-P4669]|uniref:hypothetical protein n=1 Tax=Salirhabdus sp. Marseille-P4669 TaxID=2042310 RepID=UPI000C7C20D5|nr:hypothetical protein [Salirhabdus sp. Marseille-P4669]
MNFYELIASIIGSLIWPITILVILLLFRDVVRERLKHVKRIHYKGFEMEFKERLSDIETKISLVDIPVAVFSQEQKSPIHEPQLWEAIDTSPISGILLSWSNVEKELYTMWTTIAANSQYTISKMVFHLKEKGNIDAQLADIVMELYELKRNAQKYSRNISEWSALRYYEIAKKIIAILRNA